eukprot:8029720-Pyramimonas_sp.AAC.1
MQITKQCVPQQRTTDCIFTDHVTHLHGIIQSTSGHICEHLRRPEATHRRSVDGPRHIRTTERQSASAHSASQPK